MTNFTIDYMKYKYFYSYDIIKNYNLSNICLQTTNTMITQVVTEYSRISTKKYYSVEMNTALPKFFLMKPSFST